MLFDIHVHSSCSDGLASPAEIVEYARNIGLDGVAITDHDAIDGSLEALNHAAGGFIVVPGIEVSAGEGHILGLNVKEIVPRGLSAKETVERIHSLSGLAVAAHPYDSWRSGVGDLILKLDFDAVEVVNGHTLYNRRNVIELCEKHGLKMVGGTDAHTLREIGTVTIECARHPVDAIKVGELKINSQPKPKLLYNHTLFLLGRKFK